MTELWNLLIHSRLSTFISLATTFRLSYDVNRQVLNWRLYIFFICKRWPAPKTITTKRHKLNAFFWTTLIRIKEKFLQRCVQCLVCLLRLMNQ